MVRLILAGAALLAAAIPARAAELFQSPGLAPPEVVHLAAPVGKATTPTIEPNGLLKVGEVRGLPKAAGVPAWNGSPGRYVTRFRVTSETAQGIRARLDLGAMPGAMRLRAWGDDAARVEEMDLDPLDGPEAWTPWTVGATQVIEIWSRVAPSDTAVQVGAVLHLVTTPTAKAAASCTLPTACPGTQPGDATLNALIDDRKKSVMKLQFVRQGSGFQCSATLIDSPRRPVPYVLTANHCIDDQPAATSTTTLWFYESTACGDDTPSPDTVQVAGGTQLVLTNFNVDATLLQMNRNPPTGAAYAPVNAARVPPGSPIVSISHPRGDTMRWGTGTAGQIDRDNERPYDMYVVNFNRGIIEPGSSGSGLFTAANGRLELRGILSQGADTLSCDQPTLFTLYGRMEVFSPEIARFIGAATAVTDDAANRPQDVTATITASPLDTITGPVVMDRQIDYAGDLDVYKFTLAASATVTVRTTGSQDTVMTLLDNGTHADVANDDAETVDTNSGITRRLGPGIHYVSVGHFDPQGTGAYGIRFQVEAVDNNNYTALWWNAAESGWGINLNHQGNIIFATLFTYDDAGAPLWLVMSNGNRQADGSYQGPIYRVTGPAFNAQPWSAVAPTPVGTMRLAFTGANAGALTYTYNGRPVTKAITRQEFRERPTCEWSAFDRSFTFNFTDLWWNPAESGWGVNITQQEDILFATLFTYGANGQPVWYVMSEGSPSGGAGKWSGGLYRTTGPAFDSVPWGAMTPTLVGSMSFEFTNGNAGTMTYTVNGVTVEKQIQRQVFSSPKTACES